MFKGLKHMFKALVQVFQALVQVFQGLKWKISRGRKYFFPKGKKNSITKGGPKEHLSRSL